MASIKIVLRAKLNSDGHKPIALRITKDRKSTYVYTGEYIHPKHWSGEPMKWVKKSYPHSVRINNQLQQKLLEAHSSVMELELKEQSYSRHKVKDKIVKKRSEETFFSRADLYFQNIYDEGKYNRYSGERASINHFKRFRKHQDLNFEDITVDMLEKFKAYLKGKQKVSERSAINYLITIRTIYNRAILAGVVDQSHYPFGRGRISCKRPEGEKIGLDVDEVKTIESIDLSEEPFLDHARNVWLISFYFAGMRAGDLLTLTKDQVKGDRLYYRMTKNLKSDSVKVSIKANRLLDKYLSEEVPHNLIFPDISNVVSLDNKLEVQKKLKYRIRKIDRALNKIAEKIDLKKDLSMHVARHTFGNIAGDKISIQRLQQLYRHSSITTTINYQKAFLKKGADDALDEVVNF